MSCLSCSFASSIQSLALKYLSPYDPLVAAVLRNLADHRTEMTRE
ncbi:MAG TPA: hypothetical protein VMO47_09390 [Rhodothermales bacterium]|nr:hypothetical protein [Rhodothermales bacterium]